MARDAILTLRILSDTKSATAGLKKVSGLIGGLAVGAVIKDAVKLEAAFSRTMSTLQASTGATAKEVDNLRGLAMKLGADTAFSANEAADAMLELAKAGIDTKDIMEGAADGTLLLATAGGTDLATAATIASNAMNTFNLKGNQMSEIAAALAGGANASSASVESLGQALQQVGPAATNVGFSLQETVAALSAFDAAGIKGSDAGTSLKTMLSRLIPQTEKAASAMDEVGLFSKKTGSAFVNANGSFKSLTEISGLLQKSLGGLSEAQRTQALNAIFGSDSSRAATVLMKEGAAGIKEYIKATNDQDAAQKMADAAMSGTAGALERMSGATETLKLAIGQGLAPVVTLFANTLSTHVLPALTSFAGTMQKHPQITQAVAIALVAVAAAYVVVRAAMSAYAAGQAAVAAVTAVWNGNLLVLRARLIAIAVAEKVSAVSSRVLAAAQAAVVAVMNGTALASARARVAIIASTIASKAATAASKAWAAAQWLLNVAMSANPIGAVIALIILAVGAVVLLWKKNEGFRKVVLAVWAAILTAVRSTVEWVRSNLLPVFTAAFNGIVTAVRTVVSFIRDHWKLLISIFLGPIGLVVALVVGNFDRIRAAVTAALNATFAVIRAVWAAIVGAVRLYIRAYSTAVLTVFRAVRAAVGAAMGALRAVVSGAWRAITGVVTSGASAVVSAVRGIPAKIKQAGSLFLEAGKALMGKLVEGLKKVGKVGVDIGRNLFNGIVDGINAAIRSVNDFLPNSIKLKGLPDIDLPDNPIPTIPRLYNGGITTGPTLAMVGDNRSGREAIVPLERANELGFGGEQTVIVEVHLDGKIIDRRIERVNARQARRIVSQVGAA